MRSFALIALLLLLCGCGSEKERFDRDMTRHYEVQCDKYYSIYLAGDKKNAKQALQNIIELSLAERSKAKYYWRFNLTVAFAQARLAVIAEDDGHKQEAQDLYASASNFMALQKITLREHLKDMPHVIFAESDTNPAETPTPGQWRKWVTTLDANNHIRWKSPGNVLKSTAP